MTSTRSVLVTGATGTQGGAVARTLVKRGHRVRALTRRPDSDAAQKLRELGAEVAVGNFDDPDSLRAAATGISTVFAMGTPFEADPATEERQGTALVDAVTGAGVEHVVYTSVASALDGTGIPHFDSKAAVERHLATRAVPSTVVAPVAFLDNAVALAGQLGIPDGRYVWGVPADVSTQYVAVADIAEFAALVIEQPDRFVGKRIELASMALTGPEVAAAISPWVGRDVQFEEMSLEPLRAAGQDDFVKMMEFFHRGGYTVDIPELHASYPEVKWHSFADWAGKQDWAAVLGR